MDEPTTALDVVIQREILEELMQLKEQLGFSVLFITHDLSLLIEIADTIAVMYAGRLVEKAPAQALFRAPRHPYTYGSDPLVPVAARREEGDDGHSRFTARSAQCAVGLPVPPALRVGHARMCHQRAAAGPDLYEAAGTREAFCWLQDGQHGCRSSWACRRRPRAGGN